MPLTTVPLSPKTKFALILFFFFPGLSCARGGEKRHKRRRHDKSLDRETSLWWHALVVPQCSLKIQKQIYRATLDHLCTVLHCVFSHVSECSKKYLLETILLRENQLYINITVPATRAKPELCGTHSMKFGQLWKHFKRILNLYHLYFVCFYMFSKSNCKLSF